MPEESKSQQGEARQDLPPRTFKPSDRSRRTASQPGELNQLPVMNLMIILIPVLLAQSAAVKLALHEVDLVAGGGGGGGAISEEVQKQEEFSLTVTITKEGFDILSAFGREETAGPTVPLKEGEYDYEGLNAKLTDVKKQIAKSEKSGIHFFDADKVKLTGQPGITYDVIVQVMDAVKWGEDEEGKRIPLFPGISFIPGKIQLR